MTLAIWKDTFTVNALTEGSQDNPDIIGLSNGNILVVWADNNDTAADQFGTDIMGQIYNPMGDPVGAQIFLNADYGRVRNENAPQVAATADGGFILTYNYNGAGQTDQLFRKFDADGVALGGIQQGYVVDDVAGGTYYADFEIVHRPDGSSIVTYRRDTGNDEDLMYRIINADGRVWAETLLASDNSPFGTGSDPDNPTAAVLTDGTMVTVFQEKDGGFYRPEMVLIKTDGSRWNGYDIAGLGVRADDVDVAALTDGGFVVTWREGTTLKAQIYDAFTTNTPQKQGTELTLNADGHTKYYASVVMLDDGGFAVGWLDFNDETVTVQTFDENGAPGDIQTLSHEGTFARDLELATSADGRILVTWEASPDGNKNDVNVHSAILDPRDPDALITVTDGTPTTASRAGSEIDGGDGGDVFYGMEGEDDFSGKKGADSLYGGAGDDELSGGKGGDALWGGAGNDEIEGDTGADRMWGGNGKDVIWGAGGRDLAYGGDGADKLWGGSNDDKLYGSDGADKLWGDKGADRLYGGDGDDRLEGGAGADLLKGGDGADIFVFTKASDSAPGANNRDVIVDFDTGRDVINVRPIDADTTDGGNQKFEFIGTDRFDDEGQLRVTYKNGDTFVKGDRDGDGRADFEIKLEGQMQLDAFDFML